MTAETITAEEVPVSNARILEELGKLHRDWLELKESYSRRLTKFEEAVFTTSKRPQQ